MEIHYELMTFGIPQSLLPVSLSGHINLSSHHEWIRTRHQKEEILFNARKLRSSVSATDDNLADGSRSTSLEIVKSSSSSSCQPWSRLDYINSFAEVVDAHPVAGDGVTTLVDATFSDNDEAKPDETLATTSKSISTSEKKSFVASGNMAASRPSVAIDQRQRTADAVTNKNNQDSGDSVVIPNHEDILLGRGNINHYGNLKFRQLIDLYQQEYETADKIGKTNVAEKIVQVIRSNGGRFLKKTKTGWTQESNEKSRYCVSHRFRNMRRTISATGGGDCSQTRNTAGSSTTTISNPPRRISSAIATQSTSGGDWNPPCSTSNFRLSKTAPLMPLNVSGKRGRNKRRDRPFGYNDDEEVKSDKKGSYRDATTSSDGIMACFSHHHSDKQSLCFSVFPIGQRQHSGGKKQDHLKDGSLLSTFHTQY